MRHLITMFWCVALSAMPLVAARASSVPYPAVSASAPDAAHAINLQAVTVSGVQPGPGLWKISKGGHVLWVLGTLTPLPKDMQWQAREVQQTLAQAQQVLDEPSINMHADIGFFGKLALLPSLIGVRNNPDGRKLQDLMPAAEYARWLALKAKYIGHDNGVEKQRPIFAAIALYLAAIKQAGLTDKAIDPVIKSALKQHGLKSTPVAFVIEVDNPRALVKDFKHEPMEDLDCFGKTLDHLESDVGAMRERANAWSMGDLDRLRELPMGAQFDACKAAVTESGIARELGTADLEQKMETTWLAAAGKALDANQVTFALLPVSHLLGAENYPAKLKARGYRVDLPEGLSEAADALAGPAPASSATGPLQR